MRVKCHNYRRSRRDHPLVGPVALFDTANVTTDDLVMVKPGGGVGVHCRRPRPSVAWPGV